VSTIFLNIVNNFPIRCHEFLTDKDCMV
jgi:hypothetical protein